MSTTRTAMLLDRVASKGKLNSPWGLALAPAGFGKFSGNLLVGNFGDGHINAFDLATGDPRGQFKDANGKTLAIDGLWGLAFGNGYKGQPVNTLFFTAGPNGESDGLYGRLDPAPGNGNTATTDAEPAAPPRWRQQIQAALHSPARVHHPGRARVAVQPVRRAEFRNRELLDHRRGGQTRRLVYRVRPEGPRLTSGAHGRLTMLRVCPR